MDLNGKKSTHLKSIKDHIQGESLCGPANYRFTNSGIYFENADYQTSVYDFATGKMVEVKNSYFNFIENHSKIFKNLPYWIMTGNHTLLLELLL